MLSHDAPVLGAVAVLVGAGAALLVRRRTGLRPRSWPRSVAVSSRGTSRSPASGAPHRTWPGRADMAGMASTRRDRPATVGMAVPGPAMVGAHAVTTLVVALGVVGVETAVALLVAGGIVVHGALRRLGSRPSPPRPAPRVRAPRVRRVPPRPAPLPSRSRTPGSAGARLIRAPPTPPRKEP